MVHNRLVQTIFFCGGQATTNHNKKRNYRAWAFLRRLAVSLQTWWATPNFDIMSVLLYFIHQLSDDDEEMHAKSVVGTYSCPYRTMYSILVSGWKANNINEWQRHIECGLDIPRAYPYRFIVYAQLNSFVSGVFVCTKCVNLTMFSLYQSRQAINVDHRTVFQHQSSMHRAVSVARHCAASYTPYMKFQSKMTHVVQTIVCIT